MKRNTTLIAVAGIVAVCILGFSLMSGAQPKAARIAGIPAERMRAVEGDERFAMRPDLLAAAMAADAAAGLRPAFVCATLGTTSSHAFDPVPAIADACADHGAWLHVDAAHAGAAYVFVRDGSTETWYQQAYLKASNTDAGDLFGCAVSLVDHQATLRGWSACLAA